MKKIAAILLLSVHFFNMAGYQLFFNQLIKRTDDRMSSFIDNNRYDRNDLVELKIPLNLPYFNDWQNYESFDGEVELNNVVHRYVMRKIARDTLFLLCLPDYNKTKLSEAKNSYIGYINDNGKSQNQSDAGKASGKKMVFSDDYQLMPGNTSGNTTLIFPLKYNSFKKSFFLNHILSVPGKPPEVSNPASAA